MSNHRIGPTTMSGIEFGLKLLQSVKEMQSGQAARVEPNAAVQARQQTGLSKRGLRKR